MPDPITPTVPETPPTPPANTPPATPDGQDPVALAKQLGEANAKVKELEEFKGKVDPVLETLWSDNDLLTKATEAHNRRLGIATTTPVDKTTTPPAPSGDPDTRNAMVNQISASFEEKVGISKMDAEKQKEARGLVGQLLKEMLDPKGNKTIGQVFEEVSLTKLPWYLENAWKLANRDNDISQAKESGKNEVLSQYGEGAGLIGSMPGGSVSTDEITLTPREREAAAKMGVSEEEYLNNKKEIHKIRN